MNSRIFMLILKFFHEIAIIASIRWNLKILIFKPKLSFLENNKKKDTLFFELKFTEIITSVKMILGSFLKTTIPIMASFFLRENFS